MKLVGCGHAKWIKAYHEETGFPGECFSDPERQLFKALSIPEVKAAGDNMKGPASPYTGSLLFGFGYTAKIAFEEGREAGDWLQQGAAFVLGPGAQCHYAHIEKFPQDHPVIEDVFRAAGAKIGSGADEKEAPKKKEEGAQ